MSTLKEIKIKAWELDRERKSLLNQLTAVNGQARTQFLLAMKLIYKVSKGSIVEHRGKRWVVEEVEDFCQWDWKDWGYSQPWLTGCLIKKDGTASHRTIRLCGDWKLIKE